MEGFTFVNVLLTFFMFFLLASVSFFSFATNDMKRGYGLGSVALVIFVLFIALTFASLRCFTIYQNNLKDEPKNAWDTEYQIDVNSHFSV